MSEISNTLYSGLKLAAILVAVVVATGCVSAKSKPAEIAEPAAPAEPVAVATPASAPTPDSSSESLTRWTVVAGNHLWGIAGSETVFNVPEKWPLLYKANLEQIADADLIYPGQVLEIPRDSSQREIDTAVNHARNRGAWAVGPVELSDRQYLKDSS